MLPISSSSSSNILLSPFYFFQFLSSLLQYSWSYHLSNYPNSFLAVNLPGNSSLLNVPFSLSCQFISSMSLQYSFSNSSTASFAFSKFSLPSQVLDSAIKPFYLTKYLSFPLICRLFRIFSTLYSSSSLIMTRVGCFFLCPFTCPTYFCILLTLTTGCIFTVLGSSSSTAFDDLTSLATVLAYGR